MFNILLDPFITKRSLAILRLISAAYKGVNVAVLKHSFRGGFSPLTDLPAAAGFLSPLVLRAAVKEELKSQRGCKSQAFVWML